MYDCEIIHLYLLQEVEMLNSLQILRGVAAWSVVFTHIQQSFFMGKSENVFLVFFGNYGGFGVDVFLF